MPEPLKNLYNDTFFNNFLGSTQKIVPQLDAKAFLKQIYDATWDGRELKDRMKHISSTLVLHLSTDYTQAVDQVLNIIRQLQRDGYTENGFEYMFFPDFIEQFGLDELEISMEAIPEITAFSSGEFAVRPFIVKYEAEMLKYLEEWSTHDNLDVRRLASEGSRPRLPWAMALPSFKKEPTPLLPILENLKNDPSEYVRRSVANNLNDIAKDHPELVIKIAKKWLGKSTETDKLVKHACRTLLKEGREEVMALFGFGTAKDISIQRFKVLTPKTKIGTSLEFSFNLINTSKSPLLLRLEYGLYYQKANGSLSKKVFKISEKTYGKGSISTVERKQSFKLISTRKFHTGLHQLSIIINGQESEKIDFQLID